MNNINAILTEQARTSIFIAHRLKTVVEAGWSQNHHFLARKLTLP
jgi:hypothetical protein